MRDSKGKFIKGHASLMTEEAKEKIRIFQKGRVKSEETRKKLSLAHKGKKISEQHRLNLKFPHPWAGKHPRKSGEGASNWQGGKSYKYNQYRRKHAPRPQPEQCEVCGAFGKDFKHGLYFDHNHTTDKFRGWICIRCNFALGLVKDNIEILESLIKYLKKDI